MFHEKINKFVMMQINAGAVRLVGFVSNGSGLV